MPSPVAEVEAAGSGAADQGAAQSRGSAVRLSRGSSTKASSRSGRNSSWGRARAQAPTEDCGERAGNLEGAAPLSDGSGCGNGSSRLLPVALHQPAPLPGDPALRGNPSLLGGRGVDTPTAGPSSPRPGSRGMHERLRLSVSDARPGSRASAAGDAGSQLRRSSNGDGGLLQPPWSPATKHRGSTLPSPLGSRSPSPTATAKKCASCLCICVLCLCCVRVRVRVRMHMHMLAKMFSCCHLTCFQH